MLNMMINKINAVLIRVVYWRFETLFIKYTNLNPSFALKSIKIMNMICMYGLTDSGSYTYLSMKLNINLFV